MHTPDRVAEASAWLLENGDRAVLALTGGRYPRGQGHKGYAGYQRNTQREIPLLILESTPVG